MTNTNRVAEVGLLVGEPARAAILLTLMDGRALTVTELARCARVTPQTASHHLSRLTAANLLRVERQGRHRYHRLAAPEIAQMLEGIMLIASVDLPAPRKVSVGPRDAALRRARLCYDHFAGRLGVAIADALLDRGMIEIEDGAGIVTARGTAFLEEAGIDLEPCGARSRRPLCRPCLDWSERRFHVAGKLGTAIVHYFLGRDLARRTRATRAVEVTPKGVAFLRERLGIRGV